MGSEKEPQQPKEQEAVFTTIVGGRPPGSGTSVGNVPRGVEVLLKKAAVDPEFRRLLLEKRGEAAGAIDLELTDAERQMLAHISADQLDQIIRNTKVKPEHRAVFLGGVGKLMLAAVIGVAIVTVTMPSLGHTVQSAGISPEEIRRLQAQRDANDPNDPNSPAFGPSVEQPKPNTTSAPHMQISRGIRPD